MNRRQVPISKMKVLVFEFICGGGCFSFPSFGEPSGCLFREAEEMLHALIEELRFGGDLDLLVPVDVRCAHLVRELDAECTVVRSANDLNTMLESASDICERQIIVAPEIENALFDITLRFGVGKKLASPDTDVVKIGSDKWTTYQFLSKQGINTPDSFLIQNDRLDRILPQAIIKPRFGAGGLGVSPLNLGDEPAEDFRATIRERLHETGLNSDSILVQGFVPGLPVSIAVWNTEKDCFTFPSMLQRFDSDSFNFSHAEGPLEPELHQRATTLINQVVKALPDFRGYLGVDMILGPKDDSVIDINPRLTTSFCQTRKLIPPGTVKRLLVESC